MKAKTGRFGASFSKPQVNYIRIFKNILFILILIIVAFFWLQWSNKREESLNKSFDACYDMYKTNALSTEYVPYMQDCMR